MKTIIFYVGTTAVFGMLAYGSMNYTHQFGANGKVSASSSGSQASTGSFRMSHDWAKQSH